MRRTGQPPPLRRAVTLAAALWCGSALADALPYYTLAVPGAPNIRDTPDAAGNPWLVENDAAPASSSFAGAAQSRADTPDLPRFTLKTSEAGFSIERAKPEIWLGDAIAPPDGIDVDWVQTFAFFSESPEEQAAFIFDNIGKRVFVQVGGNISFTWIDTAGNPTERIYTASSATSGRPYKMFWTEAPFNAPPIDLNGKFVKLFGPKEIIVPKRGTRVQNTGGYVITNENVVVEGVYYDPQAQTLSAYGRVSGQFLLAYYDTGSYDTLKHLQVIEVGEPDVHHLKGFIGEPLSPHGSGYGTTGLKPAPVTSTASSASADDNPYFYQHKGSYSYSPKRDSVYPLRDTSGIGEDNHIDIYWMEEDLYGVSWPFERCQYACSWNTNAMPVMVAGDSVKIPGDYTVELIKFQEPNGHARAPQDNVFTVDASYLADARQVGYSCLKLMAPDNVWFLPIRAVRKDNPDFFRMQELTDAHMDDWSVGMELVPRGGIVSGTAPGYAPVIDKSVPGRLDPVASGTHYNPQLYYDWTTTSNDFPSVIYAVNTSRDGKPLEVHWYTSVQEGDMPAKVCIPCLPQRYNIIFPDDGEEPQIVLASQQGSSATSICTDGRSLYLAATNATVELPPATCFGETVAGVSFWGNGTMVEDGAHGRVLTLENDQASFTVDAARTGGGIHYTFAVTTRQDGGSGETVVSIGADSAGLDWHNVLFALSGTNATALVDGEAVAEATFAETDFSGYMTRNTLGAHDGAAAPVGLILDVVLVGAFDAADDENARGWRNSAPDPRSRSLSLCLTFPLGDIEGQPGTDERTATEEASGRLCAARNILAASGSAPHLETGVFLADATPVIYRQNDPAAPGYNPNEEHAFVGSGHGGYFAWALRCDLNKDDTSHPGVLVQYEKDGRMAMKYFAVLVTNELYTALADTMTAGTVLPGPHPLDLLDNPWMEETYWGNVYETNMVANADGTVTTNDTTHLSPAFRDRKSQIWARCAGTLPIHMYYPNQDGFDFTDGLSHRIGEAVPWLGALNDGKPVEWTWNVEWPENIESMRIGETLTKAANGLPEVWGAKSMAVVYPEDAGATALLWDPTVVRRTGIPGYATPAAFLKDFGFEPDKRNVMLRGGNYTFKDLPPSVGGRFYVNSAFAPGSCVCLAGELETSAGGSILYPNVLNKDEIDAIKALVPSGHEKKSKWDAMVATLPTTPIEPSPLLANSGAKVEYKARDHYALTAMGATNYVTLIENDSTLEEMGVEDGDPISMHILRVTDDYYPGRVVTREDPLNLLSQQLSILYTESFAGKADGYEFEWKKASPNADGSMSEDYEGTYRDVFDPSAWGGLTRFTIGQQGDTLANLVNTFYVMRYRAKAGTPARKAMGDRWSDWCGPALAEGWLQRCVNNVTPFTQRMQDLYENAVETDVSMLRAAGAPWQGDVALNQDNLTEVGLIQLYQTLLNKAESISLSVGLNETEANKQLLLAAERLADLYVLLGNEALADALNPTIGFGNDYGASAVTPDIDYGAASSGLFCFDNQVPSLLDEELALLRGRTGANNPSVTTAPFYNRLVWNFTRGITAGEVAYAVNYGINSDNGDARLDEDDAALQYPQGHGDAWGHYLSALNVWYRLLRNPNFSWSTSQMQMNVADSVVDVDYYDEERFAETAGKLARTANEIMDRTARKVWKESGGADGAGYLDADETRNFGYGEWATRGGIGGLMNWMVANSLLPASETAGRSFLASFGEDTRFTLPRAPVNTAFGPWTFEFGVNGKTGGNVVTITGTTTSEPTFAAGGAGSPDNWSAYGVVTVRAGDGDGTFEVVSTVVDCQYGSFTNYYDEISYDEANNPTGVVENVAHLEYRTTETPREIAAYTVTNVADGAVVAFAYDGSGYTLRIVGGDGVDATGGGLDLSPAPVPLDNPFITFGGEGFTGAVTEMRFWRGVRSTAQLHAARAFANPREETLLAYSRGVSATQFVRELPDETSGGLVWGVVDPVWKPLEGSGLDIAFDDKGLLRINRATATDLETIPGELAALQRKLEQLDSGMNPLGLSDSAVPFDISPEGVADGSSTHFEQIASRAEIALGNAARILDYAQEAARHLRQVSDAEAIEEDFADESELDFKNRLISIYGMPYEDDIGPTGAYEQGYDGPDYYHYMYMDLERYGVSGADNLRPVTVVTYNSDKGKWSYTNMVAFMEGSSFASTKTYNYHLSANGLVVKPKDFTGSRKANGKLQENYQDYILAYVDLQNAIDAYKGQYDRLSTKVKYVKELYDDEETAWEVEKERFGFGVVNGVLKMVVGNNSKALAAVAEVLDDSHVLSDNVADKSSIIVGLASGLNPLLGLYVATGTLTFATKATLKSGTHILDAIKDDIDAAQEQFESRVKLESARAGWSSAKKSAFGDVLDAISSLKESAREIAATWARMVAAAEQLDTTAAEGVTIQDEREQVRARRANRIIKLRYNDMFFRQMQNAALSRYSQAFDLAQKYVYMAAQTYDYETTLLSSDRDSGDAFRAEIVGARSLGMFASDGSPLPGTGVGDPGLADILARMKANYLVLKPRLGLNNPDRNTTWFSLRKELLRIDGGAAGDADWRLALSKCVVDDIRTVPEYQRYCQSVASSSALQAKEPALVLRFGSTIDFARNFFGNDLRAGDHALDSSYYATRIAAAAVRFDGYPAGSLAATPVAYLVPAGADRMRVPGGGENGTVLDWNVADQVIPIPYQIGSAEINDPDYVPLYTGNSGNVDAMAKIRRIPSFRAQTDDSGDIESMRLVGRSAWNTKWVLIIPAGQLLGGSWEDRGRALSVFINGEDADRDGVVETPGVSDIKLGLKTYANSGN